MARKSSKARPAAGSPSPDPVPAPHVQAVRRFGRFYTRRIGVLRRGLLESPYSLAEARLIYELAHRDSTTASELATELELDPGYVSRLLARLGKDMLLKSRTSKADGRVRHLSLSVTGRKLAQSLDELSNRQVEAMLAPLSPEEQTRLVGAMDAVQSLLWPKSGPKSGPQAGPREDPHAAPRVPWLLRTHEPGDLGWIVERHGALYAREYGWGGEFEALVAEIAAAFLRKFDPRCERCWIAEREGVRVGSILLVKKSATVGQLRLHLVEPAARGLGIGQRLVAEVTRFARQAAYRKLVLWTNDVLVSARRLYEAEGYRLTKEERHTRFGKDLKGQSWELRL